MLRLMAIFAHPDDESMAVGGTLARYAAEGVEVSLVTATRGELPRLLTRELRPLLAPRHPASAAARAGRVGSQRQGGWDIQQEARRLVGLIRAVQRATERADQVQPAHRASDTHVEQPPLLLELPRVVH